MKNIFTIALTAVALFFNGCISEGPRGPVGPQGNTGDQGPQGPAGESSFVFEFQNINFTAPNYEAYLDYPSDFVGYDTDVTLVYLLWDNVPVNGENLDDWRPLPQTVFNSNGLLVYNYDFTKSDVRLFLNADFSLNKLTANETDQWVVRVVVVPGNFWTTARMDKSMNYNQLMELLKSNNIPVQEKIIQ